MNAFNYTFDNCTMYDAANQAHMLIPMDMNGLPCYPGDVVCDENDMLCEHPFAVYGIGVYDGSHGKAHTYIVDKHGNQFFSDEIFHVLKKDNFNDYRPLIQ